MKRILTIAAAVVMLAAPLFARAPLALADDRTTIGATAALPLSTANVSSTGAAISYDVVHLQIIKHSDLITVGLSPVCTVENVVTYSAGRYALNSFRSAHVEGGLLANFTIWHITVGAGEILRPGQTLAPALSHWTPTVFVGVRL